MIGWVFGFYLPFFFNFVVGITFSLLLDFVCRARMKTGEVCLRISYD